ncbi:cytochrome P450, partial [Aureobasidium melanogenum]|uniref:Cytochrome P450 n=1 Tax=Aureobasidium melanogenum (strain CBS 110374) TaxID=1043003 RepID=A0A074VED9_AURM1
MTYLSAVSGSIFGAILLLLSYRAFFHPLADYPGPRLASITGLWRLWHYIIGDWSEIILELHKKYGKVFRLAPNELSVVDESAMKALFGHNTTALKTKWYSAFQSPRGAPNILATQDTKVHAAIRRRFAPAFKMTVLLRQEDSMQKYLDKLWQSLEKPASDGTIIDMCHYTETVTWDIIGQLCFGEPLGAIVGPDALDLANILNKLLKMSTVLGHVWGQIAWVDNPLTRFIGMKNPIQDSFEWASRVVQQHEEADRSSVEPDTVDYFLNWRDAQGKPATHLEVVEGAFAVTGAGADTVAIAMRAALYHLNTNPAVLQKLREEIDVFDADGPLSYKQTQQLPYLKAVVRESLRMYSPVPAQLYRIVPSGGLSIDDRFIPSGTVVGISSLAQNRDPAIFGLDANIFNPDRWLGDESKARYFEAALFNFGGTGIRSCPGRDLAMIELYKFVAQMVQKFDFELVDQAHPWSVKTYFFAIHSDMRMRVAHRKRSVGVHNESTDDLVQ